MKKAHLSWSRLFLWSHVIGVIGFYSILWLRTRPAKTESEARQLPMMTDTNCDEALQDLPTVSIIVPARNEERNIRRCVTSLLEQNYPCYEVIVVDDESTDATPAILDELAQTHPHGKRLWVLRLRELPPGWAGKPHAIQSGVEEANGDWLLFTDADTWHAPNALRDAVAQAIDDDIDLLSLGSQQELPGFWNKVLMPMAYLGIAMQYPPSKVNDPRSSIAIANGQFILIRRAVYEQLGGYARPDLRDSLIDDRDLAQVVKHAGYHLRFVDGRGAVHVRMYEGLEETWRGWRKNVFLGSRGGIGFMLLQLLGLPMVSVVPFLLPILIWIARRLPAYQLVGTGGRVEWRRGPCACPGGVSTKEASIATLAELSLLLPYRHWIDKELGVPWYYAFTHPLAGAVFEGILAQSTWRVLSRRGVDWRGRRYYQQKYPA